MKVLVATSKTQGKRKNDFTHAIEGEFVSFTMECDGEKVDGPCGCRRSFAGFDSRRATTTVLVAETDMTREDFVAAYRAAMNASGWGEFMDEADFYADADELLRIAAAAPVGTVLEKRGVNINTR